MHLRTLNKWIKNVNGEQIIFGNHSYCIYPKYKILCYREKDQIEFFLNRVFLVEVFVWLIVVLVKDKNNSRLSYVSESL